MGKVFIYHLINIGGGMKKWLLSLILILCLSFTGISHANLISNPGFESYSGNDFAFWTEGGVVAVETHYPVYEGSASARLGVNGEAVF